MSPPPLPLPRLNMLLPLLMVLMMLGQLSEAVLWSRALQTELANGTFGGIRLCTAASPGQSVNITAVDVYNVSTIMGSAGLIYTVRSQFSLYVLACDVPPSPDGTFTYLRAFLVSDGRWDDVCANTRSLTIYLIPSTNSEAPSAAQPCNYTVAHGGLTTQQVTAWILVTYSADWNPDWVNRTSDYPADASGAATVTMRGEASPWNVTWTSVTASGLPAGPMTSGQKAQAVLASVSTTPSRSWWLLICSVVNASANMLVSVRSHGSNETLESYMNCNGSRTALVWSAPPNLALAAIDAATPAIESPTGGYWGRNLQRMLTGQSFADVTFCGANASASGVIQVTGVDNIAVSPGGPVVRGTFTVQVTPCSANASAALGDAYLKTFLRTEGNWTDVCANSVSLIVGVNLDERTAVQFRPCPQADSDTANSSSIAAKAAWCILALNTSTLELEWTSRDAANLVEPGAASVTFRVYGEANGTVLQWGNVIVNGLTTGDQVDRLVQAFQSVDTAYWPVICQLVNASTDGFLNIQIIGGGGNGSSDGNVSSRTVSLYSNCSAPSELSIVPPNGSLTTTASTESSSSSSASTTTTRPPTTPLTTTTTSTTSTASTSTTSTDRTSTTSTASTSTTSTARTSTAASIPTTTPTTRATTPTVTTATVTSTSTAETSSSTTSPESGTPGSTTLSPSELQALQQKQNLAALIALKQSNELGTQIAVLVAALLVLAVLGTFGVCKIVLPRVASQ